MEDGPQTTLDRLVSEASNHRIITFCEDLDRVLNGGVPLKKITEFCGVPGVGKTQMAFQLAINCSIPKVFGGVDGKCIYVDTEGNFSVNRLKEMATHLIDHLNQAAEVSDGEQEKIAANDITVSKILGNIYYYRVHHYIEQVAFINHLPLILSKDSNIKMIIFDSVTYQFRRSFPDIGLRTRCLSTMALNLYNVAESFNVAMVLMNQMTTKIESGKEPILVPCFNDALGHVCSNRVSLYWKNKQRYCRLYKSASFKATDSPFEIDQLGVRGIPVQHDDSYDNQQHQQQE